MKAPRRGTVGVPATLLLLAAAGSAWGQPGPAPLQLHPERTTHDANAATGRRFQLVVRQDPAGARIVLGGRTVLDAATMGTPRLMVFTVAFGKGADLFAVVGRGGTACPVRFAVVSVDMAGRADASAPFGTCADLRALEVDGDALVFTMPEHPGTGHPPADAATRTVRFRYAGGTVQGPLQP